MIITTRRIACQLVRCRAWNSLFCHNVPQISLPAVFRHRSCSTITSIGDLQNMEDKTEKGIINYSNKWEGCRLSEEEACVKLSELSVEQSEWLKLIKTEYEFAYSTGMRVPQTMTNKMWLELLQNMSVGLLMRNKQLFFWHTKEARKKNAEKNKEELMESDIEQGDRMTDKPANRILLPVFQHKITAHQNHNIYHSMMYGPHLVIDCSFEHSMKEREIRDLVRQLMQCHASNRQQPVPYHLHFCNLRPDSLTYHFLDGGAGADNVIQTLPYTFTERHYLDEYPVEDLVMLSPDANRAMTRVDENKVYIIGGIVDKAVSEPLTLSRAKREGIETLKLPLQKVRWGSGAHKDLTLNSVFSILCDKRNGKDWVSAIMDNVAARHLADIQEKKNNKMFKKRTK